MSTKSRQFLLIGGSHNDPWQQLIKEASSALGTLQIGREIDALKLARQLDYDIIIIDAAKIENTVLLVSSIRIQRPDAKIVVATTSPTWRRARGAFEAGATDYIRKSMTKREIQIELRAILSKQPPVRLD